MIEKIPITIFYKLKLIHEVRDRHPQKDIKIQKRTKYTVAPKTTVKENVLTIAII